MDLYAYDERYNSTCSESLNASPTAASLATYTRTVRCEKPGVRSAVNALIGGYSGFLSKTKLDKEDAQKVLARVIELSQRSYRAFAGYDVLKAAVEKADAAPAPQ